jgi:hypothetical protein
MKTNFTELNSFVINNSKKAATTTQLHFAGRECDYVWALSTAAAAAVVSVWGVLSIFFILENSAFCDLTLSFVSLFYLQTGFFVRTLTSNRVQLIT